MKTQSKSIAKLAEIKLFLALMAVLGVFLVISLAADARQSREAALAAKLNAPKNPFADVSLTAKAAYVYDARTREVLFAKNETTRLPLASLTKVMSALVVAETVPGDSIVSIGYEALMTEGDSGLLLGERWRMRDLLDFSLTTSSNDGMRAAAIAAGRALGATDTESALNTFIQAMNNRARELQMKNTYYFNETGLDESSVRGGAYGSAKDQTHLFEYVLSHRPELLEETESGRAVISSLDKSHTARNTNVLANVIPGLRASKTGYTDIAGGNLIVAFDPELGHPIIVSVLGSTEKGRFEDVRKLVNATLLWMSTRDRVILK